jgi:hypothetical protein
MSKFAWSQVALGGMAFVCLPSLFASDGVGDDRDDEWKPYATIRLSHLKHVLM